MFLFVIDNPIDTEILKDYVLRFSKTSNFNDFRRVHITERTLENLGDAYDVESGNGGERDAYLANLDTYLIINKDQKKVS